MDANIDARAMLDHLVRERREDYAALSRLIGRNAAYIQQFIKRGSPRHLAERDRALLARYFGVDEQLLGGPAASSRAVQASVSVGEGLIPIRRYDLGASAGGGAMVEGEEATAGFAFDPRWLRQMGTRPHSLSMIRVEGDSMAPTLNHGDDIMVDSDDAADRLRDGIYVLRRDGDLFVKRLALSPGGSGPGGPALSESSLTIISDNPAYPPVPGCRADDLVIVGRVVWAGRRIS